MQTGVGRSAGAVWGFFFLPVILTYHTCYMGSRREGMHKLSNVEVLLTPGRISEILGEKIHRVRHALEGAHILPIAIAGHAFVYPPEAVELVRAILMGIDIVTDHALDQCRRDIAKRDAGGTWPVD